MLLCSWLIVGGGMVTTGYRGSKNAEDLAIGNLLAVMAAQKAHPCMEKTSFVIIKSAAYINIDGPQWYFTNFKTNPFTLMPFDQSLFYCFCLLFLFGFLAEADFPKISCHSNSRLAFEKEVCHCLLGQQAVPVKQFHET